MHTVGPGIWRETLKKKEKWKLHTVGTGIWWENWQMRKMRNSHGRTCNLVRNSEKPVKWETHTVGSALWWETVKNMKYEKYTK